MGVPSYFSYLIRNHREMLIKLFNFKKQINNLYFDSNSIIYDGLRFLSKDYKRYKNDSDFERDLINLVCKHLEDYITEIKPNKRVMIAFDGVAPVAKLEQHRTRRHKSMLEKKVMDKIFLNKQSIPIKPSILNLDDKRWNDFDDIVKFFLG